MKNRILLKILAYLLVFVILLSPVFICSSCIHKLSFGELTVCGEIDMITFAPVEIKNSFDIDAVKIFAVIEMSGIQAQDSWKFVWINEDTGEVIAESTDKFSKNSRGYLEGYLSYCLTPDDEAGIIGKPGNYRVDFYHNGQLISSDGFIIEVPVMEITGVILSREIDESNQPASITESFYPDDVIYTTVGLNYRISGETIGVKWYKGEDELLGGKELNIDKNYYLPDYIKFTITNEESWPVGDYKIEVYKNEILEGTYYFKVVKKDIPDATFNENNIYENEEYKFSILYPDNWNCEEKEISGGLDVIFKPLSGNTNTAVRARVLKKGYYPSEEKYSQFSDKILKEVFDLTDNMKVETEESMGGINGINYNKTSYHYLEENEGGWDVDIIYINRNSMLYLLIKISDVYYREFSGKLFNTMLESMLFE